MTKQSKSWRDVLPVHPAADLFPMMSTDERKTLGEDIKKNGLAVPILLWQPEDGGNALLLDGRNRLDAMEAEGLQVLDSEGLSVRFELGHGGDPYELVLSANIHRRHLTLEQKRDLIAKVLKAQPKKSNRTIGKQIDADHKTVGAMRDKLEARGEIPHVSTVEDTKGRKQPTRKPSTKKKHRDIEDYITEKKTRLAATQNIEAQSIISALEVDNTVLTDAVTSKVQMDALSLELKQFYDDYSARVREWARICPDHQFTSVMARLQGQTSSQLRRLAQEIEGNGRAPAASEELEVA